MGPRERNKTRRAKTHTGSFILISFFGFLLVAGIAFGVGMVGNINNWLKDLPDYTDADAYLASEPTTILDAAGNEIASLFVENRENIDKDQCAQYVLDGTVATEDERFYEHNGVDVMGILRAAVVQLTGGSEGGSTITQQLVRNTILSEEQFDNTIERKVREAYIALQMEKIFTKDEILMMYLNTIPYGHNAYGIQAAAETYFSKDAKDLTLAESALLVALPNAPSLYDPTINPDLAVERRNLVLDRMLSNGKISQEEHDEAQAEELKLNVHETELNGIYDDPYFVDYVKTLLSEEFSTDVIFSGGLTVKTTIDPDMQEAAERAVNGVLDDFGDDTLDGALIAIDPDTGYIKAMVGGKDYYSTETTETSDGASHPVSGQQNMTTSSVRGCGSTFKTITLTAAVNAGMNPNTTYLNCNSPYRTKSGSGTVENFGNDQYGNISLARATELSSNTGYVRVQEMLGTETVQDMARKLGVDDELPYVDTMTLGPGPMSPLSMAEVYATLASGGQHREAVAISEITSRSGKVLYQNEDQPEEAVSDSVANAVINVLKGVLTSGTGTGAQPSVDQPVFGKTGTTDDVKDLWFTGATPQLAVAVWTGHRDNSPITYPYGGEPTTDALPNPIFRAFINEALADAPREEFPCADAKAPAYKDASNWSGATAGSSTSEDTDTDYDEDLDDERSDDATDTDSDADDRDDDTDDTQTTTPPTTDPSTGGNTGGNTGGGTTGGNTGGGTTGGGTTDPGTGGETGGGTTDPGTGGETGGGTTDPGTGGETGGGTTDPGTGGETGGGTTDPGTGGGTTDPGTGGTDPGTGGETGGVTPPANGETPIA